MFSNSRSSPNALTQNFCLREVGVEVGAFHRNDDRDARVLEFGDQFREGARQGAL